MKNKTKKQKIYIFRHGQTSYNRDKIFTGFKDSKLTPLGKKQAKIIARKLKNKKFQVAFYTRLSRSKDTMKEVLKTHPECKKKIKDDRMIERSYGKLEGTSHKSFIEKIGGKDLDFLEKQGDALESLDKKEKERIEKILGEAEFRAIHRGYNVSPPKGESFADVEKRVGNFIRWLKKFIKKNKVNVAISGHGNSIRLFRKVWENLSIDETEKLVIPYDKVFVYEV